MRLLWYNFSDFFPHGCEGWRLDSRGVTYHIDFMRSFYLLI